MKIFIADHDLSNLYTLIFLPDRLIWNAFPCRTSGGRAQPTSISSPIIAASLFIRLNN